MDILGWTPAAAQQANFTIADLTTSATVTLPGDPYAGPVSGLEHQYVNITPDNLNIASLTPNAFIHSGFGTDGINVSQANGNNILDGSAGSNFLIGGTGTDTFYMDDREPTSPVFSTIVNFHAGDNATVWGVNASDFKLVTLENQGAAGALGLDFVFTKPGHLDTSFVLAGYTGADLTNGRLTASYGTTPNLSGLPGSAYLAIHAN
jgi:Ca2+-binding RTX toxin-like protein